MYPILGRYGPFFLFTYTVVLGLGLGLALLQAWALSRRCPVYWAGWKDGFLLMVGGALVAGWIGFVWWRGDYFSRQPLEAIYLWRGGTLYHAALLGGWLTLWLWARKKTGGWQRYAGLFIIPLAWLSCAGWLACWWEGCAYGRPAVAGWLVADLPDDLGVFELRYQAQMAGLALSLAAGLFLVWLRPRLTPATLFWWGLGLLSAAHFSATGLRGDPALMVGSWRLDMVLDGALAVAAISFGGWSRWRNYGWVGRHQSRGEKLDADERG